MLHGWKQVGLTILGSKIFLGLVVLEDRYAVCKGYGITASFESVSRAHDFHLQQSIKIGVKENKAA